MHNEAVAVFVLMNLVTAIIAPGQRRKKQSCHEEETELFWTTGTDTSPVQLTTRRERERALLHPIILCTVHIRSQTGD